MRRISRDFKSSNFPFEYSIIHSHFLNQSRHFDIILSELNHFDDQKKQSVNEMKKHINIILTSNYGNIISNCEQTISAIQKIITKEKEIKLSAFAHDILCAAVSIIQIVTGKNNTNDNKVTKIQSPRPPDFANPHNARAKKIKNETIKLDRSHSHSSFSVESKNSNNSQNSYISNNSANDSNNKNNDNDESGPSLLTFGNTDNGYVVCRICDENVPVSLIEDHMNSCVKAYNNASTIININSQLSEIIKDAQSQYMNVKWPGTSQAATMSLVPLLIITTLVDQALQIDVHLNDSQDDLNQIINRFTKFKTDGVSSNVLNILKSVRPLLKQKLRASRAISTREVFLRQTMINGGSSPTLRPQAQISDFDFIKRISKGAYASVYLARKKKTGDIYAIKVIPKSSLKHNNQIKRVIDEKNILLQLRNPYIVKFFMEFLPGGDLYSLLQKLGSLDESATKYYLLQVLYALQYLHSNGIIHRDLKPDNILVAADGRLKITDFGLSYIGIVDRHNIPDQSLSRSKSIVGTPDYVAPEIILNETHNVSADYWSLGVMLYECLVGEPPFHGQNEQETFDNIISGRFQIDDDLELSKKAIDLISKLLTVDPAERLGTKDITDIINHPFFNGVNVDDEPPFKPVLQNEEDTEYFDTRYQFNIKEEADIISDISNCKQNSHISCSKSGVAQNGKKVELKQSEDNKMINNFESVSLNSLAEETRNAVKRRQRSKSFMAYNNNNSEALISPSQSSSEFISSPSPSPPSSSSTSSFQSSICSSNGSNATSQLSILQPSPPQQQLSQSPLHPQTSSSSLFSQTQPNAVDNNLNSNTTKNSNTIKPLINASHAETLVIPFHKQSTRNASRRKHGATLGSSGYYTSTIGGSSIQPCPPLIDQKKSQTIQYKMSATQKPSHTSLMTPRISYPKDYK